MVPREDGFGTTHRVRHAASGDESTTFWCLVLRCLMPSYVLAEKLAIANLELAGLARCVAQAWGGPAIDSGTRFLLDPATLRRIVDEVTAERAQRPGSRVKS